MNLDHATSAYIGNLLAEGKTLDEAAQALTLWEARKKVEHVQREIDARDAYAAQARDLAWAPIRHPLESDEPELVATSPEGVKVLRKPQPQVSHVRIADLDAFAKEHKLDAKELLRLIDGEIAEHRGFTRAPWTGYPNEQGTNYKAPNLELLEEAVKDAKEAERLKTVMQAPVQPRPVDFVPDSAKHVYTPKDN